MSSNHQKKKNEVMEEISSQNSNLGLEDLEKLERKCEAENVKRVTSWGILEMLRQTKAEN